MKRRKTEVQPPPPRFGPHFLRQWRDYAGKRRGKEYTLEEVGELVELTHAQLSRIERRQQPYNQGLLERLKDLYGAPSTAALIERNPFEMELWHEIDRYADFLRAGRA